jgi:protein-disulfide isomerase
MKNSESPDRMTQPSSQLKLNQKVEVKRSALWFQFVVFGTLVLQLGVIFYLRSSPEQALPPDSDAGSPNPSAVTFQLPKLSTKGNPSSKFAIVEFADYECPFCKRFATSTYKEIDKEYVETGRVRYSFVDTPLPNHSSAFRLSTYAFCSGQQNKYWEMHDHLFAQSEPRSLDEENVVRSIGLDAQIFRDCITDSKIAGDIRKGMTETASLGIRGTPTFLFGVVDSQGVTHVKSRLAGAQPYDAFRTKIEDLIRTATSDK